MAKTCTVDMRRCYPVLPALKTSPGTHSVGSNVHIHFSGDGKKISFYKAKLHFLCLGQNFGSIFSVYAQKVKL